MAKVFQYLIILAGISALMSLSGVIPTGFGTLLNTLSFGNLTGLMSSNFISYLSAIFTIVAVAGITAGLLGMNPNDSTIRAGFVAFLLTFVMDFINIIVYFNGAGFGGELSWIGIFITLVYFPILVGYLIALVQFWGGNDI